MNLRLSEKHGVNPSVEHCFFCGESFSVVLFGRMKGDAEAPRSICSGQLCDRCQKVRDGGGVFLIEVSPEYLDKENPRRTGRMCALKKGAIRELLVPPEFAEDVIRKRWAYVEEGVLDQIGVPREDIG
jgi:hypothetical protein